MPKRTRTPPTFTPAIRFRAKVDWFGGAEACWRWLGAKDSSGYGVFRDGALVGAHRFAYEQVRGPIPEGLTIDHLCRNPSCVNPAHLEAVTMRENVLRGTAFSAVHAAKTHCSNGHEFTPENTRRGSRDERVCVACHRAHGRDAYRRRTA